MPANITELMNANLGDLSLGNIASAAITLILCLLVIRIIKKIFSVFWPSPNWRPVFRSIF